MVSVSVERCQQLVHRSLFCLREDYSSRGLVPGKIAPLRETFGMFLFGENIFEREHKLPRCKHKASVCVLFLTGGCDSL